MILVGVVLGSTRGAAAAALYLLEGFSGLPVFAQGHGGALWLLGPTGRLSLLLSVRGVGGRLRLRARLGLHDRPRRQPACSWPSA